MTKKSVLGRGLGALIDTPDDVAVRRPSASILEIEIDKIEANPWQPRSRFDDEKLNELATSIKELGIIQPLTLRKVENDRYQIIAGERRFRAAGIAGLTKVPAYIRSADDDTMLELALVENIQREDLDPIEVAISYQRLMDECNLTQESMSERVGKKRSTIANYLRLLKLPAEIQLGLREKQISMGHARALISINDPQTLSDFYGMIIEYDLSVRKIEEMVRDLDKVEVEPDKKEDATIDTAEPVASVAPRAAEEYGQLKQQLSNFFRTNIQFSRNAKGKGKIVIPFRSDEDLEKIVSILDKANS
ncbi:MAG: ParB/RepB/Spo0J family partition protein [Cytophagaceae bacterium]|jgi:ParB family chromosome partitioning protein|nr:ParB/RepB/Spo0J family partition protein [Cytophagaceae bacterium]